MGKAELQQDTQAKPYVPSQRWAREMYIFRRRKKEQLRFKPENLNAHIC
jgi:hypothetical protein